MRVPAGFSDPSSEACLIVVPPDWRQQQPFAPRFAVAAATPGDRRHVVDLAAIRFETDQLRRTDATGQRTFLAPDLSSFRPGLTRAAFDRGLPDLLIVQAPSPEELVDLRAWFNEEGIEIAGYIPDDAYLIRIEPRLLGALQRHARVFWAGLYQPAFRVEPKLEFIIGEDATREIKLRANFDLTEYRDELALLADLKRSSLAVLEIARTELYWTVLLQGAAEQAFELAVLPGCLWVERFVDYELHNNVARTSADTPTGRGPDAVNPAHDGPIMDVEDVWARGIRGEGQIAAAADTGLSTGNLATLHQDYGNQADPVNNPMRVIKGYALGRPPSDWSDPNPAPYDGGHGTHTSGSIVGNGFRSGSTPATNTFPSSSFAGTAPKAGYVFQSVMTATGTLGGIPSDLNRLFQPPYDDGARVHSNSWGSALAGEYTTTSQMLDQFTWNHPDMVITFSAGNSGVDCWYYTTSCIHPATCSPDGVIDTDSIGAPGTAKNCITIGASENYRPGFVYEYPELDCTPGGTDPKAQQAWGWFSGCAFSGAPNPTTVNYDLMADNASGMGAFSSRGPVDDGRIKPEVVAPGIAIISTRTDQNQGYEQWGTCDVPVAQRPYYLTMGGTSMSNPLTAGTAVLVRQYFADGWHANGSLATNTAPSPAHAFNPTSALVKAILINGAWDMSPGQYGTGGAREIPPGWDTGRDLPNNVEGYGRVDLEHSLFPGSGWGDDPARKLEVHDVTPGLTTGVNHAYTFNVTGNGDPLIATLVWTDPFAATGAGTKRVNNLDLEVKSPSASQYVPNRRDITGVTTDTVNTVEQVIVSSPATGAWTINVRGQSVPGNGQAGTTTQPYALVISGIACWMAPPANLVAASNGPTRIDISWSTVAGAAEYRVLRSTTQGGPYGYVGTATAPATAYADTTVAAGTTYFYVVRSYGSGASACESADSTEVSQSPCALPPSFAGLASVAASCSLQLTWSPAARQCSGAGGIAYNVYRSTSSGFLPDLANRVASGITGSSFTDSSALVTGTTYYYIVRAVDTGNGAEDTNLVRMSGSVSASSTAVSQSFAAGDPPSGWSLVNGGTGTQRWTTTNPFPRAIPAGMTAPIEIIDSDYDGNGKTQDDHLITPAFDCSGAGTVTLEFDTYFLQYTGSTAYVDVSSDAGTTWKNLLTRTTTLGSSGTASHQSFNITSLAAGSNKVKVRFRYTGTWGYYWLVDNVSVTLACPGAGSANPAQNPFLTAKATSGSVKLEWKNPPAPFASTMVRYRPDATPTGPTDGTQVCSQAGGGAGAHDTCSQGSLANGQTYRFAAFAANGALYSAARAASARPFDTSGKVKWAFSTGASSLTPPGVWPGAVGVGEVMAVSNDRTLYAMNPTTGATGGDWPANWTPLAMNGPSQDRPGMVPFAVPGSSNNRVIYLSSQDGHVYCVDADTGGQLWQSNNSGDMLQGSPAAVFTAYGGAANHLFAATRNAGADNKLYCMSLSTGGVLADAAGMFDNGGGANGIGIIASQPLVDYTNSRVYFTSRARSGGSTATVWCATFNATGLTGALAGFNPPALGDSDATPILFKPTSEVTLPKRLYVGTNASRVYALNPTTGAALWNNAGSPYLDLADGPIKGYLSPQPNSNRLYAATTNKVWCLNDAGGSASVVWSLTLPGTGVTPSTPMFIPDSNHLLLGASNGRLYQLDTTQSPPPTTTYVTLGTGNAAVGPPAFDVVNNVIYAGTEAGVIYAIAWPLS